MKRFLLTVALVLSVSLSFSQNVNADRFRFRNEYMSINGPGWYMNPNGPVENYIVLYNFSDITFKVRVVIQELGIDITAMVTPEGNVGYPQETWIDIGSIPALNDETGANPQMQVKLWAEAKGIKFHLSDTWFSRRR